MTPDPEELTLLLDPDNRSQLTALLDAVGHLLDADSHRDLDRRIGPVFDAFPWPPDEQVELTLSEKVDADEVTLRDAVLSLLPATQAELSQGLETISDLRIWSTLLGLLAEQVAMAAGEGRFVRVEAP